MIVIGSSVWLVGTMEEISVSSNQGAKKDDLHVYATKLIEDYHCTPPIYVSNSLPPQIHVFIIDFFGCIGIVRARKLGVGIYRARSLAFH